MFTIKSKWIKTGHDAVEGPLGQEEQVRLKWLSTLF